MNQSQRTAALVVRLTAFALVAVGVMGLLYALLVLIRVGDLSGMPAERLWTALIWVLFGLLLFGFGKRLGEWIGRGLE